jgi:hypothetical protein
MVETEEYFLHEEKPSPLPPKLAQEQSKGLMLYWGRFAAEEPITFDLHLQPQ